MNAKKSATTIKQVSKNTRGCKPWISVEIIALIKDKDHCFKPWKRSSYNKVELRKNYNKLRNQVNSQILISKQNYYRSKFGNSVHDIKETWKTIHEAIGRKPKMSIDDLVDKSFSDIELNTVVNNFDTAIRRS